MRTCAGLLFCAAILQRCQGAFACVSPCFAHFCMLPLLRAGRGCFWAKARLLDGFTVCALCGVVGAQECSRVAMLVCALLCLDSSLSVTGCGPARPVASPRQCGW